MDHRRWPSTRVWGTGRYSVYDEVRALRRRGNLTKRTEQRKELSSLVTQPWTGIETPILIHGLSAGSWRRASRASLLAGPALFDLITVVWSVKVGLYVWIYSKNISGRVLPEF